MSDRCPLCGKGPYERWYGAYKLGEYHVCVECYKDLPMYEEES